MEKKHVNRIYQIYELRDSIKSAIDNINKLISSQELLVKSIEASPIKAKELDEFVKGIKNGISDYRVKLVTLEARYDKASVLTELHESNTAKGTEADEIVTLVIEAMGLDQPEPDKLPN